MPTEGRAERRVIAFPSAENGVVEVNSMSGGPMIVATSAGAPVGTAAGAGAGTATDDASAMPGILMVAGIVVLGMVLMLSIRGKIARRQAETPTPRQRLAAIKSTAGGSDTGHQARAGLVDTARRLASQLDVKAARLEQLIAEADDRIATIEEVVDRVGTRSARVGGADGSATSPFDLPGHDVSDPLTVAVYELADEGQDPVDIARQLDEQIGKVELILALRASGA